MQRHIIYESDYEDFELYVIDEFKIGARAYVFDKEEGEWHQGYVVDIKEGAAAYEDENDFNADVADTKGDYTGDFQTDFGSYYVGIKVETLASPGIETAIDTLKNYSLNVC